MDGRWWSRQPDSRAGNRGDPVPCRHEGIPAVSIGPALLAPEVRPRSPLPGAPLRVERVQLWWCAVGGRPGASPADLGMAVDGSSASCLVTEFPHRHCCHPFVKYSTPGHWKTLVKQSGTPRTLRTATWRNRRVARKDSPPVLIALDWPAWASLLQAAGAGIDRSDGEGSALILWRVTATGENPTGAPGEDQSGRWPGEIIELPVSWTGVKSWGPPVAIRRILRGGPGGRRKPASGRRRPS